MALLLADAGSETSEMRLGAFAGPIDIVMLSLGRRPGTVDVCSKCLTLSRRSALRCHMCNAKLPACGVALADPGMASETAFVPVRAGSTLRAGWLDRPVVQVLALGLAMVCVSVAATQLRWLSQMRSDGDSGTLSSSSVALSTVRADQVALSERTVAPAMSATALVARAPVAAANKPRVSAARARARVDSAMIECGDRNFLLRAICMNNRCTDSANALSASCVSAVSQRRLDEARRNPLLVG